MATSKDIFLEQQSALVDELSKRTLTDNSNRTYGSVLNQDELGVLAVLSSPELNTMAQRMMSPDVYNQYVSSFDPKTRLSRYNLPPIDYSDPVFEKARETYKAEQERMRSVKEELRPTREAMLSGTAGMPIPERIEPFKFGYEDAKTIASLGINPEKELDTENSVKFRNAMAFGAPRNLTPKDLNYAKENLGLGPLDRKNPNVKSSFSEELPGEFAYVDPSRPELGIAYFEEGKEPVMYDSPLVGSMDVAELALQEGPLIAAEVLIGAKGLNKFDDFLKAIPRSEVTKGKRILDSVAGNVLLSGGAATTNLFQRLIGLAYGAHDRGLLDMVKESGWLFLLAYAGNQTVDAFLNGIPKLYRIARGQDIEAAELAEIRAAIERIRESKEGVKVKGVGGREEAVSLLDIDEAITQLSAEIGEKIPAYNPTMAQASKDSRIADIERLLIESGANPQYKKFYDELMAGNEETIQRFFNALYGNLDTGVTAQTVGKEITNLFNRQRGDFVAEGEAIISRLRGNLDDFKKAGDKGLLDEVVDKKASSNLYTRFTSRINNLSREYKEQLGNDIDEALKDERLQNLFSGRLFRKNLLKFKNASQGEDLINVSGKEAAAEFVESIVAQSANPSASATVAGQLANLLGDFDVSNPPSWAAGAMRAATAEMARRGMGASSIAGQAIVQAAMEAALPIAQADAQIQAQFEGQNLSNRQQMAVFYAQQRASFIGQEFDQTFQSRVTNAARISDIADKNFTAQQQVVLENSRAANTMNLQNLSNKQALTMAEASSLAQIDIANLSNRQQTAVLEAQAFLQKDMSELSNDQQTRLFNAQQRIQSMFTDAAADNARKQFNASTDAQTDQFFANLATQTSQFNGAQKNAIAQFNSGQQNTINRFNAEIGNQRDQFNQANRLVIDQANAVWRRSIATADTAAINRVNELNASALLDISDTAYNDLWQQYSDVIEYAYRAAENQLDRAASLAEANLNAETRKQIADEEARTAAGSAIGSLIGTLGAAFITGGT